MAIALRTGGGTGTAKEIMEEMKARQPQQRKERKEMKEDGGVVYERTAPGGG